MAKRPIRKEPELDRRGYSRRDFFKQSAAAGVGAAVLAGATVGRAQAQEERTWDYEADIIICGGGCLGLSSAIRARDAGASVIVIDQNFDLGGRMLHSGAFVSLGGGDPVQKRDMAGGLDAEEFLTVPPVHKPEEMDDTVELLFTDMTDWSIVDAGGYSPYRYNERDVVRAWADNAPATRQFLIDNYVRFGRVEATHGGGGLSRARGSTAFLMLGDKTDIKAGTVTAEDAGQVDPEKSSHFAVINMTPDELRVGPGAVSNGAALSRSLEFSAREKGVQFLFFRHLDEIIRENQFEGNVLGVRASYSPRMHPDTGELMTSLWSEGNLPADDRPSLTFKANKAVIVATGGHAGNPVFRSMYYPALRDPAFVTSGFALQGPGGQDASGIIASMRVGAILSSVTQNLSYPTTFHIPTRIGTRDAYTSEMPGHPTFGFRGSAGINIGLAGFEDLIAVNQVGKRFYNEMRLAYRVDSSRYPGGPSTGAPLAGLEHKPLDWRNNRPEWVRQMYNYSSGKDAAVALNEGSVAPDFYSGPIWAIFDQAAAERTGWELRMPYVSETNGYFFSADTLEELADKIKAGHEFQRVPLTHLVDTVNTWNSYVDTGTDPEFERGADAPMHKIEGPKFYAASIVLVWHDSYGGLRINGSGQVLDTQGQVIPHLYSGGEAAGGINKHGLGRGLIQGYIAGGKAVTEVAI